MRTLGLMYEYWGEVIRVLDGDTVLMDVDLGFHVIVRQSCRLAGINSRELHDDGGKEARDHLIGLLPVNKPVLIRSVKPDKFAGRFDGIIVVDVRETVNYRMVLDGYAVEWDGKGKRPLPAWPIVDGAVGEPTEDL
jgi:micrococcal nuclease